jgi:hypothetical protein
MVVSRPHNQGMMMVDHPMDLAEQSYIVINRPVSPVNQEMVRINRSVSPTASMASTLPRSTRGTLITPQVGPVVSAVGGARVMAPSPGAAVRIPVANQPDRYTQLPSGEIVKLVPVQVVQPRPAPVRGRVKRYDMRSLPRSGYFATSAGHGTPPPQGIYRKNPNVSYGTTGWNSLSMLDKTTQ